MHYAAVNRVKNEAHEFVVKKVLIKHNVPGGAKAVKKYKNT